MKKPLMLAVAAAAVVAAGCMGDGGKCVHLENLPAASAPDMISPRAAVDAALAHAGPSAASVRLEKCETDREWGTVVYEIEFKRGFFEYEYEVDARNGKILSSEKSWDW